MNAMSTLAVSESLSIAFFAINMVVSLAVTLGMFWLKAQLQEMTGLKNDAREYASQLIKEKFDQLGVSIATIHKRLERGDDSFRENLDRDHKLELKTLQVVESIKREMATRIELQRLADQIQKHGTRLAAVEQRGAA